MMEFASLEEKEVMSNIDSPDQFDVEHISHRCDAPARLVCRRDESRMDFSGLLAKNELNHVLFSSLPLLWIQFPCRHVRYFF